MLVCGGGLPEVSPGSAVVDSGGRAEVAPSELVDAGVVVVGSGGSAGSLDGAPHAARTESRASAYRAMDPPSTHDTTAHTAEGANGEGGHLDDTSAPGHAEAVALVDLPPLAADARTFAIDAHGNQRYGVHPYVTHLDDVVGVLRHFVRMPPPELLVIGFLHDVVEDTEVTLPQVGRRYGDGVARCVDLLTDMPGHNRKERKKATYARLAEVPHDAPDGRALVVKAADRLANARRCVTDDNARLLAVYRGEHPTFRAAAWRPSLVDELWRELDDILGG